MAVHYRTRGIVLRKADLKEADQLFSVYTEDFGKINVLGRAIRKITSKLRSGMDILYFSDIEFIQSKTRKTLTDALVIDKFQNIREALPKLKIAYQIAGILDELVSKEEKDDGVWELTKEIFEKLNGPQLPITTCQLLYYYFFWNLVSLLGYQPKIDNCSIQGRAVHCDAVKILRLILKKDWPTISRLKISPNHIALLKNISKWFIIEIHGHKK